MPAFVELIVQKIADAAPLENTMSNRVAAVPQNTAAKLARCETYPHDIDAVVEDAA